MAEKETGWTREWPSITGYYWRRIAKQDPPSLVRIVGDECRFTDGSSEGRHECYEFLGPVTVSDAEQLSELRKLAEKALSLKWLRNLSLNHRKDCAAITLYDNQCSCGLKDYLAIDDELRAAVKEAQ